MLNNMFKKKALAMFMGLMLCAGVDDTFSQNIASQGRQNEVYKSWTKVYSFQGNCHVVFPRSPDHVKQNMAIKSDGSNLEYDVYVADLEKRSVYMALIAKYPGEVREDQVVGSLEHFLNSILVQNPNNQLVFANLVQVQGCQAMDFFIKTNDVFFKGRVLLAKNYLYLLAMECEKHHYQDEHFQFFIESFELIR